MRTYVQPTEQDFDSLLKAEKGWKKELVFGTREIVYVFPLKSQPVTIKVYSSLIQGIGLARGCGKDAIRVCAINPITKKGIAKTGRINRVGDWQSRLKARVIDMIETAKERTRQRNFSF